MLSEKPIVLAYLSHGAWPGTIIEDDAYNEPAIKTICRNCKYFKLVSVDEGIGECHRYPPKVVILSRLAELPLLKDVFVIVSIDNYCGEYAEKKS